MQPFSLDDLYEGLRALAEKLEERNVYAHLYVVGGAAMAMTFVPDRTTRDIDAVIGRDGSVVLECVTGVADERQWPANWLNDNVTKFVRSVPPDRDREARVLWAHRNLLVSGAPPKYLLAVKVRANRPTDNDDIRVLLDVLGIQSKDEVFAIHDAVFPEWPLADVDVENVGEKVERLLGQGRGLQKPLAVPG